MLKSMLALAAAALLAACAAEPLPQRSIASTPIGSTATSGPYLDSAGSLDINRDYNIGADPNFPGGMGRGSRGIR
jgi:uncharacterized lipoprotein YajG